MCEYYWILCVFWYPNPEQTQCFEFNTFNSFWSRGHFNSEIIGFSRFPWFPDFKTRIEPVPHPHQIHNILLDQFSNGFKPPTCSAMCQNQDITCFPKHPVLSQPFVKFSLVQIRILSSYLSSFMLSDFYLWIWLFMFLHHSGNFVPFLCLKLLNAPAKCFRFELCLACWQSTSPRDLVAWVDGNLDLAFLGTLNVGKETSWIIFIVMNV